MFVIIYSSSYCPGVTLFVMWNTKGGMIRAHSLSHHLLTMLLCRKDAELASFETLHMHAVLKKQLHMHHLE